MINVAITHILQRTNSNGAFGFLYGIIHIWCGLNIRVTRVRSPNTDVQFVQCVVVGFSVRFFSALQIICYASIIISLTKYNEALVSNEPRKWQWIHSSWPVSIVPWSACVQLNALEHVRVCVLVLHRCSSPSSILFALINYQAIQWGHYRNYYNGSYSGYVISSHHFILCSSFFVHSVWRLSSSVDAMRATISASPSPHLACSPALHFFPEIDYANQSKSINCTTFIIEKCIFSNVHYVANVASHDEDISHYQQIPHHKSIRRIYQIPLKFRWPRFSFLLFSSNHARRESCFIIRSMDMFGFFFVFFATRFQWKERKRSLSKRYFQ